jgi:hypothetical protein
MIFGNALLPVTRARPPMPVVLYRCYTVLVNQEVQRYDGSEVNYRGVDLK